MQQHRLGHIRDDIECPRNAQQYRLGGAESPDRLLVRDIHALVRQQLGQVHPDDRVPEAGGAHSRCTTGVWASRIAWANEDSPTFTTRSCCSNSCCTDTMASYGAMRVARRPPAEPGCQADWTALALAQPALAGAFAPIVTHIPLQRAQDTRRQARRLSVAAPQDHPGPLQGRLLA